MKKNNYNNIYIVLLLTLLVLYLLNSSFVVSNVLKYTDLFIKKLFPASFIFFTLSSLCLDYKLPEKISSLFNINGYVFYVIIMSMISGFPSGSKYIRDLYDRKLISNKLANYLITFTHFPNPIFILGPVSSLFMNNSYSIYILVSLIVSNLIIGLFLRPKNINIITTYSKSPNRNCFSTYLTKAIYSSIEVIILIYGSSIFFYLIGALVCKYISFNTYFFILINGFFDLTKGIFLTSILPTDLYRAIFILLFISFGGISVNIQIKSIISDTQIKYSNFLLGRIFQFIISLILFFLWCFWSN